MIPHRGINRLVCNSDYVQLGVDDRIAQVSNNSFDAATFEIWGSLLNGGRAVLMEGGELLVPARFEEWIESEGVTTLFLTTALFNEMVRQGTVFAGVKQVLFGGEMVDTDVVRKALEVGQQTRLLHVYGPTEGTTFSSWHEVNEVMPGARSVAIGKPIANTQTYILDEELQLTLVGVPGELCLGGIGLGRGLMILIGWDKVRDQLLFAAGELAAAGERPEPRLREAPVAEGCGAQVEEGHRWVEVRSKCGLVLRQPGVVEAPLGERIAQDG
jgi:non-ribosomal peptide synthetase component F